MSEYGIHHLPIVDGDRVVGMLALEEVLGATAAPAAGSRLRGTAV
jgi:CBS domain-containing protein